jgi:hypothetical protein
MRAHTRLQGLPVSRHSSARKQGKALNVSDCIGGGHDLNLLGGSTSLHCDHIFVPGSHRESATTTAGLEKKRCT